MPSCNTYCLTLFSLTLDVGYLFVAAPAKRSRGDKGYLLMAAPLDLVHGLAPLGPPAPTQPPLLGYGVAPPGRLPWLRAGGGPSRLPPLASDPGWLLSAPVPGLGCGVGPPSHRP